MYLNVEVADIRLRLIVKDAAGSAMMINWTTTNNREVQSQEIALSLDGSQGTFAILKPACTTPTIDHILLQAIKKAERPALG